MLATATQPHLAETTAADRWEWAFCPSPDCTEDAFLIRLKQKELWEIRADLELPTWLVAATHPVCPACATTLTPAAAKNH